jgi:antirestriction protein ArdC
MSSSRNANSRSDDKLAELHEQITEGVAALVTSDAWRAMLDTTARFHTYSLGNLLLIGLQAPHATRVAGFRTWQSLGRQVRKGEHGIAILAPCTYRPKNPQSAEGAEGATSNDDPTGGAARSAADGRQVRGFRAVHVFDVAQTDGEPLPDVAPALLTGQAPAGLWDKLAEQVAAHGFTLERGDCRGANGYTDPATQVVRIRADVHDAQAVKTLAHELGHLECGHVLDLPTYLTCRGRCEIEAESVAYVVAASVGLDTSGYSFAYVAGWAGGEVSIVRQTAETVTTAARTILGRLAAPVEHDDRQPQPQCQAAARPVGSQRATQDA